MPGKNKNPEGQPWTANDVNKVVTNPIYTGIGPYQRIVPDDQWIEAVRKMMRERGAHAVLKDILENLREAFPPNDQ